MRCTWILTLALVMCGALGKNNFRRVDQRNANRANGVHETRTARDARTLEGVRGLGE
jgi:hypothetical protein